MAVPERQFTCVGRSGSKITHATTTVYASPDHPPNVTDLLRVNSNSLLGPKKARIVLYYNAIFDTIGRNVLLPCKTVGRPHAEVYWMDTENNIVDSESDRYKVLPSGELQITSVRWSDMGLYTCIARNAISKDSISTFLYPMLVSVSWSLVIINSIAANPATDNTSSSNDTCTHRSISFHSFLQEEE